LSHLLSYTNTRHQLTYSHWLSYTNTRHQLTYSQEYAQVSKGIISGLFPII